MSQNGETHFKKLAVIVSAHFGTLFVQPIHATSLFLFPLKTSRGIERDQWHKNGLKREEIFRIFPMNIQPK